MIIFLIKSAGIIALFLGIYKMFLERDIYFKGIRIYFILGIALSLIIPFISITKYVEAPQTSQIIYSQNYQNLINAATTTPFNWLALLLKIYVIGIALSGIYFIYQIISLLKIINTKPTQHINNLKIIETTKNISPFSFFNYIVYNPAQFTKSEIKQLLKHEQTHILHKHSIDMLLAHLLVCFQWFNPFAWWYRKAINLNLEYIADKTAKHTIAPKNYAYLLLKTTVPNYQIEIANNFYNSLLKKRIMMLHKNHSPRLKQFKLALILPLLVGFIFTFNTKVVAQHKDNVNKEFKVNLTNFSVIIDKDTNKSDLDFVKTRFAKFGFSLEISNLKRNAKNEITGIKIYAKKAKSNAQFAINGDNPIQPIKIEYQSNPERIYIGNTRALHFANKGKGYKYHAKTSVDPDKPLTKDQFETVFFDSDKDSLHQVKVKVNSSFVFFSNDDKDHITAVIKTDDNNKHVWKDKNGKITKIVEVKTNGKPSELHKLFKIDEDGNIITVSSSNKDKHKNLKFIVKSTDDSGDIDASQFNDKFIFNTTDGTPPLFVVDGKMMKDGFPKKLKPSNIKSIVVLKGVRAINKYGRKGKNGVIEIYTRKKSKK